MGLTRDERLPDQRKILAVQRVKLPRYRREGAVEVRPFPAKMRLRSSEAQGLSGEAVKGNPPTTVIPGVDESKPSHETTQDSTEPNMVSSRPSGKTGMRDDLATQNPFFQNRSEFHYLD